MPFSSCGCEAHQPAALFVVQLEPQRADAVPQCQRRHVVEDRVLIVCALEVVVRDARAQMMDVVQPDVAGEELQNLGQLEV